jgi:hypothetical protein
MDRIPEYQATQIGTQKKGLDYIVEIRRFALVATDETH